MAQVDIKTISKASKTGLKWFLITFILYFLLIGFTERGSYQSTFLKCLPIVNLWVFVMQTGYKLKKFNSYTKLIMMGLMFSCAGDILLNYELIEPGMAGFAMTMICYILAFGFHPLRPWLGLPFYAWGAVSVALMFNNFSPIIKICFPIYCILLMTMCWRALARIDSTKNILRMGCGIGGVLFVISDSIIAFDMFYAPISNAKYVIMLTYYLAQFGISLSIIDETGPAKVKSPPSKKSLNFVQ